MCNIYIPLLIEQTLPLLQSAGNVGWQVFWPGHGLDVMVHTQFDFENNTMIHLSLKFNVSHILNSIKESGRKNELHSTTE